MHKKITEKNREKKIFTETFVKQSREKIWKKSRKNNRDKNMEYFHGKILFESCVFHSLIDISFNLTSVKANANLPLL